MYISETRQVVARLRKSGYSVNEIANKLNLAKSTVSLWVRNIKLEQKARKRLEWRVSSGIRRGLRKIKSNRTRWQKIVQTRVLASLSRIRYNKWLYKLLCSFLFWTEGGKSTDSYVYFINSDPLLVATFMKLMRKSFELDEAKFRALIHIHQYHNEEEIKVYWSEITKIPSSQFSKSYNKPNTRKRIRVGYKGSIRIRYYDSKIAHELRSMYNIFARKLLGV